MMRYLLYSFIHLLLINSFGTSYASISNAEFSHISTERGLSQKTVQAIYQSKRKFVWIGTQEGLNRYDGKNITIYRHNENDEHSLSHDVVRDIIEDANGKLWVATNSGLNLYNPITESFTRIKNSNRDDSYSFRINTLHLDRDGVLWVGTDGDGIFKVDDVDNEYVISKIDQFADLNKEDIRSIYEDSRGRLWIGTDGDGIYLYSFDNHSKRHFRNEALDLTSLSHNRIRTIIEDHKGKIWIGTRGGGVNRYDELSKSFERFQSSKSNENSLSHDRVYKIFLDSNKNIWIGTDGGLSFFNEKDNNFTRIQHYPSLKSSLSHNRVLAINEDVGGLLWFGTQSGINIWNPITAKFVHYSHRSGDNKSVGHNYIHGFAQNKLDDIYIATYGGGLHRFDQKTDSFVKVAIPIPKNSNSVDDHITTLEFDRHNNLWIGTLSMGVILLSENQKNSINFASHSANKKSLSANGVTDILEDRDGDIWISTYRGGLNKLSPDNQSFTQYRENANGLTDENIFQIVEGDEGYIWLATDGGGIFKLDKNTETFTNFSFDKSNPRSLSGNTATSILQDSKGRFWIGTQGYGLNRWEATDRRNNVINFKHYNVNSGLNSSTVNGILEDEFGFIWISTNRGVTRINPENDQLKHYNLSDEIHGNEFSLGSYIKAKDGRFYFGGLEGISAFYPNDIKQNPNIPSIILTNITSEGKNPQFDVAISDLREVNFDYKDYLLTFEFAALDFAQPDKNQYQYKLEGFDDNWVQLGTVNRATFTNLPGGNYVLKVRGSNNDGIWSEDSINLKINVSPAPWASWWAYGIYAVLLCGIFFVLAQLLVKRLAHQEVFKDSVAERVREQTVIYVKINEYLKEQLELVKYQANVDIDTGLPNQKYLYDLVKANLYWIDKHKEITTNSSYKLCLALIRLPEVEKSSKVDPNAITNNTIKEFAAKFTSEGDDYRTVVRWNKHELGILFFVANVEGSYSIIEMVRKELNQLMAAQVPVDVTLESVNIGYALVPFTGVNQEGSDGDDLLMLTEHFFHLVNKDSYINAAGLTGLNVMLNTVKFRQIMGVSKLKELNDIFNITKH